MIFPYQPVIVVGADGDYLEMQRPEIEISVVGQTGTATILGLVDTGSDTTIFPKSIADELGIPLVRSPAPPSKTFGGLAIPLATGHVELQLESGEEKVRWSIVANFFDFESPEMETVLLGHAGFLEFFTATFDGQDCSLALEANDDLPRVD